MVGTNNVCNQGIAHLAFTAGSKPFCGSVRAHIVCAVANKDSWGRICVRCEKKLGAMNARKAQKA